MDRKTTVKERFVKPAAVAVIFLAIVAVIFNSQAKNNHESSDHVDHTAQLKGLTASETLQLGVRLCKMGRVEEAREVLTHTTTHDPDHKYAEAAQNLITSKLPPVKVTRDAEQRNIVGVNQRIRGQLPEARKTLEAVIHDYPKFDWAYGNLALVCIDEKKLDEAKSHLDRALEINPNYANGWKYMGQLWHLKGDEKKAQACENKSHQWD